MSFKERAPFGRTGLMVSRIGLASGYGVPTAAIEKAFHEHGINYLWLSVLMPRGMVQAIRNLAPRHRDEMRIELAWPGFGSYFLESYVERWLRKLKIEQADLMVVQGVDKPPSQKLVDRMHQLKQSGKVRFLGMSSHTRPLFAKVARGEVKLPVDFFHVRYNAVHPGAEQDVFPHLPKEDRPGITVFTASCWRKLHKRPLAPADCYRFVLSHPDVNVCVVAPSTAAQMEDDLKALDAGPLDAEEMAHIRRLA
jgi:aryl-alcohol dehydrogenase-like predicted oxidoreductase